MMKQSALSFISEIDPSKKTNLLQTLEAISEDVEENSFFPFASMTTIHFARFIVLEDTAVYPPYLVFFSNYDGELNAHIQEIIHESKDGFESIFSACKNFPDKRDTQLYINFIKQHANYRSYFYRGTWGRSVEQIRHEEQSRLHTENFLDEHSTLRNDPLGLIVKKIKNSLSDASLLKEFPTVIRPKLSTWKVILIALLILPFLFVLLPLIIAFILLIRIREIRDKQQEAPISDFNHTVGLKEQEDASVQNQITHLVDLKPGWIRRITLTLVLEAVYYSARVYYNKGKLGNISTIHFARWVIIDKGKRLLFTSNFDGSWESYLSDFVDRAAIGLTAVWSNTVGFPRTKFLALKGARDEQRFKSWTRNNQIPTQVWYSAYKDLTVKNVNRSTEINDSLFDVQHNHLADQLSRY